MENRLSECSTGRLLPWLCPVHASQAPPVMSPVCIFPVANDNARVQQRAAYGPEHGCDLAWRQQIVDIDGDLSPLQRECAAVVLARALARWLRAGRGRHAARKGYVSSDKMWCNRGSTMGAASAPLGQAIAREMNHSDAYSIWYRGSTAEGVRLR